MKKITLLACAFFAGLAFNATAQEAEIVLTQNTDEVFLNGGVSCPGGDNWWIRSYDLADYGITDDVMVTGMEIAISNIDYAEEFEFYAFDHIGFPSGFDILNPPAYAAFAAVEVGPDDVGVKLRITFDDTYRASAGSTIVVAAVQPYVSGNRTFLMTTAAETKASYLAAENCGITEPDTVGNVGFADAMHFINLVVDDALSVNNVLEGQVAVYPNPASDVFNIQLPANVVVNASSLVDILGKTTGVTYSNGTMNVSALAPGVYFLNLETNMGSYTQKVVKQ